MPRRPAARGSRIARPPLVAVLLGLGVLLATCAGAPPPPTAPTAPRHVYLTWQGDPSTTMTVNYQTLTGRGASHVYYDTTPHHGDPDAYAHRAPGEYHRIEGLADKRRIHHVELRDLQPDTTYYFVAGTRRNGFSEERAFHTPAAGPEPLRFVVGGDLGMDPGVEALMRYAAAQSPRFAVIGGDIAYVNGQLTRVRTWDTWLDRWEQYMVTPEGYTIPMILAIGNHEVRGAFGRAPDAAPFYYGFFAQKDGRSYFAQRIGANAALIILDSGHTAPHEGEQSAWLDRTLAALQDVPYRFAAYHVPLYPSHRPFENRWSAEGRRAWLPLFDRYALTAAFEHHDHVFKRTHPLRGGKVVETGGTLYLGDGCWRAHARGVDAQRRWYEARAASVPHVWCVDVTTDGVTYRAIDLAGHVFDAAGLGADAVPLTPPVEHLPPAAPGPPRP